MADSGTTTRTCGNKSINYPSDSTFVCVCAPKGGKCTYTVIFPNGGSITGTDLVAPPKPKPPHVVVSGSLQAIAVALERISKRHFVVPPTLRNKNVRMKTLRGTTEDMAEALGLEVAKKSPKKRPR